ncbi:unnamed protein product [Dovyalis caffra]|uniref:PGG domain-containing protein n=1 Tax=Dovyalis caffra TaxID=77055 RepID=A0AAV1STC1_9ROSI|nr:unnamed protein product [Dovyalis caffra]
MEMASGHEDLTKRLFEASIRGCVATLDILLQKDPLLLDRISLTSSIETPLHISSLLGHVDFTGSLLLHKPKLTAELNSQGQSPLHLASAEGYVEIVKDLLSVNTQVCLVFDQFGRIPLHLAAMRGRVDVMQLLISACSTSIQMKSKYEQHTVLHLCVQYNHLEALKVLTMRGNVDGEFLNSADTNGNTILQLAMMMQQVETIKYLVSIPEVRVEADNLATIFTNPLSFDSKSIQEHCSIGEPKSMRIKRPSNYQDATSPQPQVLVHDEAQPDIYNHLMNYLDYQGNWMEKTRGNLMVVATVIASMSFQAVINPPGGVWQDGQSNDCPNGKQCKVGTAVLSSTDELKYNIFIASNTISFSASLAIIFLLMGGFTLRIKAAMFIMLFSMCTTVLFIAGTYITSIILVGNPDDTTIGQIESLYLMFWVCLPAFIIVYQIVSFVDRVIKKLLIGAFHVIIYPFRLMFRVPRGGLATEKPTTGV